MTYDHQQVTRLVQTIEGSIGIQIIEGADDYPEAPFPGQVIYRKDLNTFQVYDWTASNAIESDVWREVSAGSGLSTFVGASEPVGASEGDLWFDTDDGFHPYRYNGVIWVSIRDEEIASAAADAATALEAANDAADDAAAALAAAVAAQSTADGKVDVFYDASTPTGASIGDLWYNETTGQVSRYNGSTWDLIQDEDIAQALADAATAQSIADGKITAYYQNEAPVGADTGDLWYDTNDSNHPYFWDGDSWESVRDGTIAVASSSAADALSAANAAQSAADTAQATADGKIDVYYQASAPLSVAVGDLWYDTDTGYLYRYNGATWDQIQDEDIVAAANAAQSAQTTADGKITAFYQNSAPGAAATGDLWYDTDDGNHPYFYNGSGWTSIRDATIAQASTDAATALSAANAAQSAADTAQATADGKVDIYYQATAPGSPDVGDLWYDTDNDYLYRYNGGWVQIQDADIVAAANAAQSAQTTADGKITAYYQAAAPGSAETGDLWYDTDDGNKPYYWDGDSWESVQDASIAAAAADAAAALTAANTAATAAATAQATADGKIVTFFQATEPAGAAVGDLWWDTDDKQAYRYDGSAWVSVRDLLVVEALDSAEEAQGTADGKITAYYQDDPPVGADISDLWYDTDDSNKAYYWDGADWVLITDEVAAHLVAYSLSVSGLASLNGGAYLRSVMTISEGLDDPDSAPTINGAYCPVLTASLPAGKTTTQWVGGLCDNVAGTHWVVANYVTTVTEGIALIDKSDGTVTYATAPTDFRFGSITRIGSEYWGLGQQSVSPFNHRLYKLDSSFAVVTSFTMSSMASGARGKLTTDGTNLYRWDYTVPAPYEVIVETINQTTGSTGLYDSAYTTSNIPTALLMHAGDFGSLQKIVGNNFPRFRVISDTGSSELSNSTWDPPSGLGSPNGIWYDGTRFWSIHSSGRIVQYSLTKGVMPTDGVSFTWTDGTDETADGPGSMLYTWARRAWLRVTVPESPTTPAGLYAKVYLGNKLQTLVPALSTSVRTSQIDLYNSGGAASPGSSTFTGVIPGEIAAAAGGFAITGASNGSIGTGTFRDSVREAGYDSTVMHRVRLVKSAMETGIANVTTTVLSWQTEVNDIGGLGDLANDRAVIQRDGLYSIMGGALVDPSLENGKGYALMIRINGTDVIAGNREAGTGAVNNPLRNLTATAPSVYLTTGTTIQLCIFHNRGSGVTIDVSSSTGSNNHWGTFLEVVQIR